MVENKRSECYQWSLYVVILRVNRHGNKQPTLQVLMKPWSCTCMLLFLLEALLFGASDCIRRTYCRLMNGLSGCRWSCVPLDPFALLHFNEWRPITDLNLQALESDEMVLTWFWKDLPWFCFIYDFVKALLCETVCNCFRKMYGIPCKTRWTYKAISTAHMRQRFDIWKSARRTAQQNVSCLDFNTTVVAVNRIWKCILIWLFTSYFIAGMFFKKNCNKIK